MQRFIRVLKSIANVFNRVLRRSLGLATPRRLIAGVSILSFTLLIWIFGAASIYFNLASGSYLRSAFTGFEAWIQRGSLTSITSRVSRTRLGITSDDPAKTFDGFTLYTTTQGTTASLIDMRGNRVHQWSRPFSQVWPNPSHVKHKVSDDAIHWFRCRPFPNGDLLAVYQADTDTPHGYGLAKLDKNSNLLWASSDNFHHDLDIGDDGKIYTLTHQISNEQLKGLYSIVPPYLADYVVVLSPEGKELEKISILEAFQNSPFSIMLAAIKAGGLQIQDDPQTADMPMPGTTPPAANATVSPGKRAEITMLHMGREAGDVLHANGVKVLNRAMATKFPLFKEGQVLISLCYLNTIAVLDVPTRSIVWAAKGVWMMQHDAEFLENGHLLLFDNSGEPHNSRVIEFDPITQSYPWSYSNENSTMFTSAHRGMKQHLPNGNVLIVDADGGRLFEVNSAKSLVWEFGCRAESTISEAHPIITGAMRYPRSELKFLEGIPFRP